MVTKRKKTNVSIENTAIQDEYYILISVWVLRILLGNSITFKAFFMKKHDFVNSDIQAFLQMPDDDVSDLSMDDFRIFLRSILASYETKISTSGMLFRNINLLSNRIHLTAIQQQLLALVVLKGRYEPLKECLDFIRPPSESHLHASLAKVMDVDMSSISKSLAAHATLRASGLIKLEKVYCLGSDLEPMDGLCEALMDENENEQALLRHFLVPSKVATLQASDYPHVQDDFVLLKDMLNASIKQQEAGVNILIYGASGSGKTELARLLAKTIGVNLFEVKTEDDDGNPARSNQRLEGYRFCQQMLSGSTHSLILFDEVEDIFPSHAFSFLGMEMKSGKNKGWINKALEENQTPAIWICNQISQIDPAFLRRFDYAMALNTPPRSVRLNIIQSRLTDTPVSDAFMQRLSEHEELSPAQVTRAARVLARISCSEQKAAERVLEKVLGNSAKAMGQKPLQRKHAYATHYSLDYLNTNIDIPRLVGGLQRRGRGNICFYGAPGTGKTALAGYIAKQLDKPLLSGRASDILGMFVGQSEQNIAHLFEQARSEDAVLILDEADSLLRDRRGANQSWEVTQVNELLVQMENFDGLFICSTNLMDDLDQASLRRFAIKVEFDYLKPDQAIKMLQQECVGEITEQDRQTVSTMNNLTPGDFAAVKNRLEILDINPTANVLVRELGTEISIKSDASSHHIGFLQ